MAERKRLGGEGSTDYIGTARAMLAALKQAMAASRLMQYSHSATMENGVQITVSSVFGQDTIDIHVPTHVTLPPELVDKEEIIRRALAEDPTFDPTMPILMKGAAEDKIQMVGGGTLKFTRPGTPTAGAITGGGPVIAGMKGAGTNMSRPVLWSAGTGLIELGMGAGNSGVVQGLASDGTAAVGFVYIGNVQKAAHWPRIAAGVNPNIIANHPRWSEARTIVGGVVYGFSPDVNNVDGGFKWDGIHGHGWTPSSPVVQTQSRGGSYVVSSDGRVRAEGNQYQLDNGPKINWAPLVASPNSYRAICVVNLPPVTSSPTPVPDITFSLAFIG